MAENLKAYVIEDLDGKPKGSFTTLTLADPTMCWWRSLTPPSASTGRPETHDYLRGLGATGFIDRAVLLEKDAPLQKERWAGGIDSVGGQTLVSALSQTMWGGAIAACGLAGSSDLPGTVLPHILRSVALLGVDSVMAPQHLRAAAWKRLARDLDRTALKAMYEVQPFDALPDLATRILAGQIRGRVVVDVTR